MNGHGEDPLLLGLKQCAYEVLLWEQWKSCWQQGVTVIGNGNNGFNLGVSVLNPLGITASVRDLQKRLSCLHPAWIWPTVTVGLFIPVRLIS